MTLFIESKAKFSQFAGFEKYTPLIYACTYNNLEIAEQFLTRVPRINIDKGDKYKRTPLIMAARNGNSRVLALLLKHNANSNAVDTSGNTALHNAAAYGWIECVRLLVRHGAETSPENAWKFTPLTIALLKNHIAIV